MNEVEYMRKEFKRMMREMLESDINEKK